MIYTTKPDDFNPKFEVVSCFCEVKNELLFLKRLDHKPQGGTWGAPAGKVDHPQTRLEAMTTELYQETGITVDNDSLEYLRRVFVRYSDYDFIYHMFRLTLPTKLPIQLSPSEHSEYKWVTPKEALELNLIEDMDKCIKMYY